MSKITLGSNIASNVAQRSLFQTTTQLSTIYERLSSGQRINRAVDDAAGLSIADSLASDKRVFNQGLRNFNDGLSLLNIADSALNSLSDITIRLTELTEQAANGVLGSKQRESLDAEAQALSKEYTRIIQTTEFNGRNLFSNTFGDLRLQGGYGLDGSIASNLGGAVGLGSFASGISVGTANATSLELGDLNGDGIQDLVTAVNGGIRVQIGNGDGSFGAATNFAISLTTTSNLALGDLNGDGILDIVASGQTAGVANVGVLLGNGQGGFTAGQTYSMYGGNALDIALGDLNGDGILDMVTAGTDVIGGVGIRYGSGNGTFGAMTSLGSGIGSTGTTVALGDINGDGRLDIALGGTSNGVNGQATVFQATGNNSFSSTSYSMNTQLITDLELADLNNDGVLDLVSAGGNGVAQSTLAVRLGLGNGSFQNRTESGLGFVSGATVLDLGDLNGDGNLDVVSSGSRAGSTAVRLGSGNGNFEAPNSSGSSSSSLVLGDTNNDGVLDLLSSDGTNIYNSFSNTTSGVSTLLEFSLKTLAGARQALPVFKQKLQQLASQRGQIGATMSRVEIGKNVLASTTENVTNAESVIRNADIATESSQLIRLGILQQTTSSILAQANLQPQLALRLLTS